MHPVLVEIGGVTITWYGVMMATGFLAGLVNWYFIGKSERRDFAYSSDLLFWIMVSGILGARIVYVLSDLGYFFRNPEEIVMIHKGGLVYYGGFLGSGIALIVFSRVHREDIRSLLDFVIVSVPLAHFFGRIGCFLNGCCYGKIHEGLLGVRFPAGSYAWYDHVQDGRITKMAGHSLPVHPVQLYESVFNLLVYFLLIWAYSRRDRTRSGRILALYCFTYPPGRFLLEFLRGDHEMFIMGLTVSQVTSLFLVVLGFAALLFPGEGPEHEVRTGA
jgi:phosphatidylglycerol:prolipoprotein diacylglycerol transferase